MFAELISPEQLAILGQIIFIDLVLAGDNAIIIGMVASKFPVEQRKKIIFWGIGGAVILRIILTLLTAYLLQITGLRLIGGLLYFLFNTFFVIIVFLPSIILVNFKSNFLSLSIPKTKKPSFDTLTSFLPTRILALGFVEPKMK